MTARPRTGFADAARLRKVHAVRDRIESRSIGSGLNPLDPATAATIAERLALAVAADWTALERDARVNPLSDASRTMLINIFRKRGGLPDLATLPAAPPPAPVQLVGTCLDCGKERDDATDAYCRRCQARQIAGYLNNKDGGQTAELLAGRAAAAAKGRR